MLAQPALAVSLSDVMLDYEGGTGDQGRERSWCGGGGGVKDARRGLTARSDPHVLLPVQHEAAHGLALWTVRCSLAH